MLLKQYGLSSDAYTFWSQMKKNTEELGSIFDAQPSQINGNIHCTTNPVEPVFGYVSITNIQTKRIYINRTSLPVTIPFVTTALAACSTIDILYLPDNKFSVSFDGPDPHPFSVYSLRKNK
jgi:hypothetical protein